ncbi:MAG: phage/plasmid primase, P4 family [Armatimonadetes bacterium]|nr:phage/plasmid primase, P4 family [Armatimonadota bacterium]
MVDRDVLEAAACNIPDELKALRQWVCYRIEDRDGSPTKIPYRTDKAGRGNAKTNSPATWHTFDEVVESVGKPKNRFNGIGFVLSETDPYVFIDLDHVVTDGKIEDWAREIIEQTGSYAEFSQSGTGVHIVARATKPGPRCRTARHPKFEIYADRRLVVFTGRLLPGAPIQIIDAEQAVAEVYRRVFGDDLDKMPPKEMTRNARPVGMSDPVLIEKAMSAPNGEKFRRLWNGNTGDYNGDDSAADAALCCMLAYWTDKDPVRMDRLFRESGLMRPKWDERHGAKTYGQMTIDAANAKVKVTYSDHVGRRRGKRSRDGARSSKDDNVPYGPDDEPLNDLGNARRLVKKHGDTIRFSHDAGKWFCWDGRRWAMDETGEIVRKAKTVVDDMLKSAVAMRKSAESASDESALELARVFERHAISSGNHQRIVAMIAQARSEPSVTILAGDLDADAWLFNCANGTIDLRTGELRPHNRNDLISKISEISYDPGATCPTWEKFIADIFQGDEELVRFVQSASGYTLTGDTREQVFFILHGCGSNGKSTFVGALRDIFGDYETKTSTDTIVEKNNSNNSNDVAALRGSRLVSTIETSAGRRLAEALVKELTGQDAVTARFLYKEFFTFVPVFKLWLACNHVPVIQGQDHGIWRRVRLVPFGVQFRDVEEPKGPYKDKALPEKLKTEYEGILAWLVRGCLDWQKDGLPAAKAIKLATGKLQQDMDVLGGFLAECCEFERQASVMARDLYSAYCRWAEDNGEKPLSQRWFGLRLSERGTCESVRTRTGKCWHGIGLVSGKPEGPEDPESETVNHENHVTPGSEKSLSCACALTRAHDGNLHDIASHGAQGSHNNTRDHVPTDDGLDWSNGVAF